jgi:hypothetical protein
MTFEVPEIGLWRYVTTATAFERVPGEGKWRLRFTIRLGDKLAAERLHMVLGIGRLSGGSIQFEGPGTGWALGRLGAPDDLAELLERFYQQKQGTVSAAGLLQEVAVLLNAALG